MTKSNLRSWSAISCPHRCYPMGINIENVNKVKNVTQIACNSKVDSQNITNR